MEKMIPKKSIYRNNYYIELIYYYNYIRYVIEEYELNNNKVKNIIILYVYIMKINVKNENKDITFINKIMENVKIGLNLNVVANIIKIINFIDSENWPKINFSTTKLHKESKEKLIRFYRFNNDIILEGLV